MRGFSYYFATTVIVIHLSFSHAAFALRDETNASPKLENRVTEELDEILQPQNALDRPGFAFAIMEDGVEVYSAYAGAADIEQQRPISAETVFHIASLSKQITAAALAFAIVDQEVSLDDPIAKWVPEASKYGDAITVAHLVYMTSGLTEYTDVDRPSGAPWSTFHYFDIDDAITASLSVDELQFKPGSEWQYSNINYMLLTRIIASAYGKSFSDVVTEKIFRPLGMDASLINDDTTTIIRNRANAYIPRSDGVLRDLRDGGEINVRDEGGLVLIRRNAPHYGGSGVMTSMSDWSRWQAEMLSKKKFGDAFWALMLRRQKFSHPKDNDAFGLVHGDFKGRATLWYEGGDIDVSSYAVSFPDSGVSISCFSNNPSDGCRDRVLQATEILIAAGRL